LGGQVLAGGVAVVAAVVAVDALALAGSIVATVASVVVRASAAARIAEARLRKDITPAEAAGRPGNATPWHNPYHCTGPGHQLAQREPRSKRTRIQLLSALEHGYTSNCEQGAPGHGGHQQEHPHAGLQDASLAELMANHITTFLLFSTPALEDH
jgi:hypothetical protein